jgi:hypothetical protein
METRLSEEEWRNIRNSFDPVPSAPPLERLAIKEAVALFEQYVGSKTGTSEDVAESPWVLFDRRGQLDCVDETHNTTIYLTLLKNHRLLTWHEVGKPANRGKLVDCLAHNAATIVDRTTGERFAIDSYFHHNGDAPEIIPLGLWLRCWRPKARE